MRSHGKLLSSCPLCSKTRANRLPSQMTTPRSTRSLFLLFTAVSLLYGRGTEVVFTRASDGQYVAPIPVYSIGNVLYMSATDLESAYKVNAFRNPVVRKEVFRLERHKFKISANNHYVMVEDRTFQMSHPTLYLNDQIYLPLETFSDILRFVGLISGYHLLESPDREEPTALESSPEEEYSGFNILSAIIEERENGTVIRLRTRPDYDAGLVRAWVNRGEWLYVTLPSATVNKPVLEKTELPANGTVRSLIADQLQGTAQVSMRLRGNVEGVDVLRRDNPPEILLTIRKPYVIDQTHFLDQQRKKWQLDRIVLDAGHGGHDPGARANSLREKDITLDVVKRLGNLIEKKTDIEIVYTRKSDKFIPLWERTKIANESEGKVFVSVHVNASRNRSASGFETYLLRPGKTDAAIEVAELENSVVQLEDNQDRYGDLSNEQLILATMAQSSFMKESEVIADLIQREFDGQLRGQNRGVKQAGFIVLIGASMPNVLVELGFITNSRDAAMLKKKSYRQDVAEAIFDALMKYKVRYEKLVSPP